MILSEGRTRSGAGYCQASEAPEHADVFVLLGHSYRPPRLQQSGGHREAGHAEVAQSRPGPCHHQLRFRGGCDGKAGGQGARFCTRQKQQLLDRRALGCKAQGLGFWFWRSARFGVQESQGSSRVMGGGGLFEFW